MSREKQISRALFIALGFLILHLAGCKSRASPYGASANADRKTRKLPVIPADWKEDWGGGNYFNWYNPALANPSTTNNPMHQNKGQKTDNTGHPLTESDTYQSGKMVHASGMDTGEVGPEWLSIEYDFVAADAGKDPWSVEFHSDPILKAYGHDKLTLAEAEAILNGWGLTRLNY